MIISQTPERFKVTRTLQYHLHRLPFSDINLPILTFELRDFLTISFLQSASLTFNLVYLELEAPLVCQYKADFESDLETGKSPID